MEFGIWALFGAIHHPLTYTRRLFVVLYATCRNCVSRTARDSIRLMRVLICCLFAFYLAVPSFLAQTRDTDSVCILGEVQHQGRFKVSEPLSLFDALKLVRGFTPYSNRHTIEITHGGVTSRIDFDRIATGKATMVQIEAGDTIRVFRVLPSNLRTR